MIIPTTPASAIRSLGRMLYGRDFEVPMARDLGIAPRTLQRLVAGTLALPPGLRDDMLALLEGQRAALSHALSQPQGMERRPGQAVAPRMRKTAVG